MPDSESPTLPRGFFERIYAEAEDPWSFATSAYERDKYTTSLAALPRARYRSAFEIGCSIGVLTGRLAERCDALLAVDVAAAPLGVARERCRAQPWVTLQQMAIPAEFPERTFDLIVVSEVGYYWSWTDLARAAELMCRQLVAGGDVLLVHWTPFVPEYPLTGDQVHDWFLSRTAAGALPLVHRGGTRHPDYRLDVFTRADSLA